MDVARCISLHNRIVTHAIKALEGKTKAKITKSWFEFHSKSNAEKHRETLPSDVIAFLEEIDIVDADLLSFTPFLRGIATPKEINGGASKEDFKKQCDGKSLIVLYQAIDREDSRGLLLDTTTLKCFFVSTVDVDIRSDWSWQPLEIVLQKWWDLIVAGKYAVDSSPESLETDPEFGAIGWTMLPFVSSDVAEAVQAWDEYISAIIRRLPEETRKEVSRTISTGWVEEEELEKLEVKSFVREFLIKARRPPSQLEKVAPDLEVLNSESLKGFGRVLNDRKEDFEWVDPADMSFPLLLSRDRFTETTMAAALEGLDFLRKQLLYDDLSGLYIRPSVDSLYSDTVVMITPYDNPNYDGHVFELKHRVFEYQAGGACPYQPPHDVRLVTVLRKWKGFIEDGTWTVGSKGVEGGIDAWEKIVIGKDKKKAELHECCH